MLKCDGGEVSMPVAILLLAAGASRRFGADNKLLAPLAGKPLVRHAADAARAVPAALHLVVASDPAVEALFPDFRRVRVEPGLPQSESLKAGVAVARALRADQVAVVLGDMPGVTADLIQAVIDRGASQPAAVTDGLLITPPASLPSTVFDAVADLTGDTGAGAILRHLPPEQLIVVPPGTLADIDTPADLAQAERPA
jgi:molybdenum cofactor cytidylyltransferase